MINLLSQVKRKQTRSCLRLTKGQLLMSVSSFLRSIYLCNKLRGNVINFHYSFNSVPPLFNYSLTRNGNLIIGLKCVQRNCTIIERNFIRRASLITLNRVRLSIESCSLILSKRRGIYIKDVSFVRTSSSQHRRNLLLKFSSLRMFTHQLLKFTFQLMFGCNNRSNYLIFKLLLLCLVVLVRGIVCE